MAKLLLLWKNVASERNPPLLDENNGLGVRMFLHYDFKKEALNKNNQKAVFIFTV